MGNQEQDTAMLDQPDPEPRAEVRRSFTKPPSLAQDLMKGDAATLSREGQLMRRAEEVTSEIVDGSSLALTPSQWTQVRSLVRQAVDTGILLERNL